MTTEEDRDRAAAFLASTAKEQRADSIEVLAELFARVRADAYEAGYEAGKNDAAS